MTPALNSRRAYFLYGAIVAAYGALFLIHPELGPWDEYAFLPTLQQGKFFPFYGPDFPYYDTSALGRFVLLGGQEYNLVALFTNAPLGYYFVNAFQFFVLAILIVPILRETTDDARAIVGAAVLLFMMPGFTTAFFRMLYTERNVAFWLAVFLASYLSHLKAQRSATFLLAVASVNAALYYKETAFIAVGAFALGHLILTWKTANTRIRALDGVIIASSLTYISLYAITVLPNRNLAYVPPVVYSEWLVVIKNILNYALSSDPIPVLLLVPLAAWRMIRVFGFKEPAHPVFDPMLVAGSGYVMAFFVLKIYMQYYLLPTYLFALPPILYFSGRGLWRSIAWKAIGVAVAAVLVLNTIPLGVHFISHNKYVPVNYNRMVDFLVEEIGRKPDGTRANVFMDGVDRGDGRGVYFVLGEFLRYKGLPIRKFDLKSNIEAAVPGPFVGRPSPFDRSADVDSVDPDRLYVHREWPFGVFQPGPLPVIGKGDYLIVSPHSTRNVDGPYIESLKADYDLIFRTESPFAVPRISLKTLVKYAMVHGLAEGGTTGGLIVSTNILNWPDYYVFRKR
jgi:hypothetical protein